MTVYAFDLETQRLSGEVEQEYAAELDGESAWSRPDLFGFACGVVVNVDTDEARRYETGEAAGMLAALRETERVASYNGEAFDFGVLAAYGSVEDIRRHHLDLCAAVREQLDILAAERQTEHRLRQGGLDGLARANGLAGKTGDGAQAVALYREGRMEELLGYCEADARLTADLYRIARQHGSLQVDAYHRDENRNRVYLPRTTLTLSIP